MPKYLIKRQVPGAGKLNGADLQGIADKSNGVLRGLTDEGENVQWVQTYVTDDALHCVYIASGPDVIREHARRGGFPCDDIMEVDALIDPTTAESAN